MGSTFGWEENGNCHFLPFISFLEGRRKIDRVEFYLPEGSWDLASLSLKELKGWPDMTPRGAWLGSPCGWSVLSNCVIAYIMVCHTFSITSVLNLKDNLKSIAVSCFNMCFHLPGKGSEKQAFIEFLLQLKIGSLILLGYNEECI